MPLTQHAPADRPWCNVRDLNMEAIRSERVKRRIVARERAEYMLRPHSGIGSNDSPLTARESARTGISGYHSANGFDEITPDGYPAKGSPTEKKKRMYYRKARHTEAAGDVNNLQHLPGGAHGLAAQNSRANLHEKKLGGKKLLNLDHGNMMRSVLAHNNVIATDNPSGTGMTNADIRWDDVWVAKTNPLTKENSYEYVGHPLGGGYYTGVTSGYVGGQGEGALLTPGFIAQHGVCPTGFGGPGFNPGFNTKPPYDMYRAGSQVGMTGRQGMTGHHGSVSNAGITLCSGSQLGSQVDGTAQGGAAPGVHGGTCQRSNRVEIQDYSHPVHVMNEREREEAIELVRQQYVNALAGHGRRGFKQQDCAQALSILSSNRVFVVEDDK